MQVRHRRIHQKAEAGDVERAEDHDRAAVLDGVRAHTEHGGPEEEVHDVAEAAGQEGDRLEDEGNCRDREDRAGDDQGVLFGEDERLQRRLAAHEDHGHGTAHEAEREGGQEDDVAAEFAEKVFEAADVRGGDDETVAGAGVAANGVGDDVEADQADEDARQRGRGHPDGRGVVEHALAVDLHERAARRRRGHPHVGHGAQQQEDDQRRQPPEADQDVGGDDRADAMQRFVHAAAPSFCGAVKFMT